MGDIWITDLRHYLDEDGQIAPCKGPARKFAEHITAIVALASHPEIIPPTTYHVRCRRRPGRRPCPGRIEVDLDWESDDIIWFCPICKDMGQISNWRKSKWDLSGEDPDQTWGREHISGQEHMASTEITDTADQEYDTSWDLVESDKGYLPINEEAWDKKFAEWTKREWNTWLKDNLDFPFLVIRIEDEDDAYFTDIAETEPFRLGHIMKAVDIEMEDDLYGIILKVREGKKVGYVPLCDVEVTSKENKNFWPVREYVVWFANR